jgi:hypothetical protein
MHAFLHPRDQIVIRPSERSPAGVRKKIRSRTARRNPRSNIFWGTASWLECLAAGILSHQGLSLAAPGHYAPHQEDAGNECDSARARPRKRPPGSRTEALRPSVSVLRSRQSFPMVTCDSAARPASESAMDRRSSSSEESVTFQTMIRGASLPQFQTRLYLRMSPADLMQSSASINALWSFAVMATSLSVSGMQASSGDTPAFRFDTPPTGEGRTRPPPIHASVSVTCR